MSSKDKKQNRRSATDQADGQGEGQRDPFAAANPQPKDTPTQKSPAAPDAEEKEDRSNLADIGEAEGQEGVVDGTKQGATQQDPPATLPQERRHERRHNM